METAVGGGGGEGGGGEGGSGETESRDEQRGMVSVGNRVRAERNKLKLIWCSAFRGGSICISVQQCRGRNVSVLTAS